MLLANGITHFLMSVIGAAAHRFFLRCFGIIATGGEHEYLLDQTGAGSAGTRCLGMLSHFIEREQALVLDRLDDGAFADSIAAAHFGGIGHCQRLALALMSGITQIGFTEHQAVTHRGHVGAIAEQLEKPGAVDGVADHHGTDQFVVLDDELFVYADTGVGQHNVLGAFTTGKIACGKQINTGDFEFGGSKRTGISTDAKLREMIGAHFRHLEQRGHQSVGNAAMVSAFTDGVDTGVVGLHGVIHDHTTITMKTR